MKILLGLITAALMLCGCAHDPKMRAIENGKSVTLNSVALFPAITSPGLEVARFHGLGVGTYKVEAEDDDGTFYRGTDRSVIFDAYIDANELVQTRLIGGFWIAKNKRLSNPIKIYRYNEGKYKLSDEERNDLVIRTVISQPPGVGILSGALGAALGAALVDSMGGTTMFGPGAWKWQFIPMNYDAEQAQKLIDIAK